MTTLLGIETSTEACSVALSIKGDIREIYEVAPRKHNQSVIPMVEQLLAEAGASKRSVDAIAYGRGPGAFTGVRIATAMTQGLAFALDRPVIPVSTLAALAQSAVREQGARYMLSAIDARMDEVYWGAFVYNEVDGMSALSDERVTAPEDMMLPTAVCEHDVQGVGSGWSYSERIPQVVSCFNKEAYPHAHDVLTLAAPLFEAGKIVPAEQAIPVYLRNQVARKK